ncbi:hypothetical protein [uncultured Ruminococcus sp.]|uniref:hypothetical protein n=1 Tax=uncultured Ruminococcus sp. TaxID=165186 RepID=UPI0025E18DE4|nr:hypothetical protein [uncultured Ruminococcus sp.]
MGNSRNNQRNNSSSNPTQNTASTTANSQNVSDETHREIDIYDKLKDIILKHKELLASAIVILGVILYSFGYSYYQGYFAYYGVSSRWITVQQSSFFYNLIVPLSVAILTSIPNFIASFPLIAKTKPLKTLVFEVSWLINILCFLYCCIWSIKIQTVWFYLYALALFVLFVLFISEEIHGVFEKLAGITISLASLYFVKWIISETIEKKIIISIQNIIGLIVVTFFITGIPFTIWILKNISSRKQNNNSQNSNTTNTSDNEDQKIKDRNTTIISYVISIFFSLPICFLMFNSIGNTNAKQKRNYNIIQMSEVELYDTDSSYSLNNELLLSCNEELKNKNDEKVKETIKDKPYLQIVKDKNNKKCVRRIVNAYVVISENDDNYLVINAYVDSANNNLYIYKSEKREIEKDGQLINSIVFDAEPAIV